MITPEDMAQLQNPSQRIRVPWWRRQYIINPTLQKKYAGSAVFIGIFSSIVSGGMLLWSFWVFNIWQGQRLPGPILAVIAVVIVLNIMGIYVAALIATNRIVGPIYNLLRHFSRVARGDFTTRVQFRQEDEIHYVAAQFNEMALRLSERDEEIFSKITSLKHAMNEKNLEKAETLVDFLNTFRTLEKERIKSVFNG